MANKLEGISVSLPLTYDNVDGPYELNKTLKDDLNSNGFPPNFAFCLQLLFSKMVHCF